MRTPILVILLTLAWVPWGGAEEPQIDIDLPGTLSIGSATATGEPGWENRPFYDLVKCTHQMEAAMRSMEPFTPDPTDWIKRGERYVPYFTPWMKENTYAVLKDATEHWNSAKRDCWTHPPEGR